MKQILSIVKSIGMACVLLCLAACGSSGNGEYQTKTISDHGKNTKAFRAEAEEVMKEYQAEIRQGAQEQNWALVQRELADYGDLVDNLTPGQTGGIWHIENYQNQYTSFAASMIIDQAKVLLAKETPESDKIMLELIASCRTTPWSVRDNSQFSKSDHMTVRDKALPQVCQLAILYGRNEFLEKLGSMMAF